MDMNKELYPSMGAAGEKAQRSLLEKVTNG